VKGFNEKIIMRQHQRRNTYNEERANAAATRKAQAAPAMKRPVDPQVQEVTDAQTLYFRVDSAARRGECAYPNMRDYCAIVDGKLVVTEYAKQLLTELMVTA
jgi:hypothetical protein